MKFTVAKWAAWQNFSGKDAVGLVFAFAFLMAIVWQAHGMSYATGHKADFRTVCEGLQSPALDELHKHISQGMDDEFVRRVRQAFPDTRLEMNHRYLGHWGFQGSIPFRQEPYQRALAAYPRKELATLWQSFCDELVERSMKATGLPERQARAYAGLHYNMHLLGDLGPGNAVIDPLPEPGLIIRDIEKNLRRLFGNRSHIAKEVTEELLAIPAQPPEHFAVAARRVMAKYPVGEALWKNYGDALQ
jgi:hypothetical protein